MLSLLPEYMLVVGLGGKPKQVSLYEEMVEGQVSRDGGVRVELDEKVHSAAYELAEGASRRVLRMFAPFSGYMPIITCVPVRQAIKIKELGEELVNKYGLIDPLSGGPLKPEVLVIPYDRCSIVYLEQEILFDPADEESTQKAASCVREGYAKSTSLYGSVHTMPSRSLLKILNPSYTQILRVVKHSVDPNNIFMGGPYAFT